MTATQCEAFIRTVIGSDLSLHEIPGLYIKIRRPRSKKQRARSYFMLAIPVNIFGEVDCELNNAVVRYPWLWTANGGMDYVIPDTNCQNMNGAECCQAIMENIDNAGIPRIDDKGNCLSCWVHQEPLEPIISKVTGTLAYLEHDFEGGTCVTKELDRGTVQAEDDSVEARLATKRMNIQNFIYNGATCDELFKLQRDLLNYARSFAYAENLLSSLLCGYCIEETEYNPLPQDVIYLLMIIMREIEEEVNSDQNVIIIYTDRYDFVIEPPKIGGSRAGLDIDLEDPDCNLDAEGNPTAPSPATAPTIPTVPIQGAIPMAPVPAAAPQKIRPPVWVAPPEWSLPGSNGCPNIMIRAEKKCVCQSGYYMTPGGRGCSMYKEDACPPGTSLSSSGVCYDCNCGFCQSAAANNAACCTLNGADQNCDSVGSREKSCRFNALFFAGYSNQKGDVCSGVEARFSRIATSVGCGCRPSAAAECTYEKTEDPCFVCSAEDLAEADSPSADCLGCKDCLVRKCGSTWAVDSKQYHAPCRKVGKTDLSAAEWQQCLEDSAAAATRRFPDCALKCSEKCYKN